MTRESETGHPQTGRKHSLFFRHISLICMFAAMFMFILSGCSSSGSKDKEEESDTGIIPIENETNSSADAAIELTEDTDPAITELFTTYFADLAKGDVEALGKVMVNAPDEDTVAKESEYSED